MSPIGIRIPANEVDRRWYDELAAAGGSRSDPSADTGNTDVMPALERRPREDDITYFKHNLDLTVHAGWDEMQKLSTDKFLYAGRIKNKTEDELLENDVRVCQVWAWEKGAVREFHARSTRKCVGEIIEVPLIPLVLAYNHTSSSLVTNRSRAIQSIRLKTKNRVVTSLWDT